jgi:hypothetical protein
MPAFTMTCPGCQTALQVAAPPQTGGVIRCPCCEGLFRLWGAPEAQAAPSPFRASQPEPSREGSSVYRVGRRLLPQGEPEQIPPGRLDPGAAPRPRPRRHLRIEPQPRPLPPANHFVLVACGIMLLVALLGIALIALLAATMPLPPAALLGG